MGSKPVALITGASSGIGADLARELAADGHDLVLTARTEAALRALSGELSARHGTRCMVVPIDLAQPAAPQSLHRQVKEVGWTVEILINNAGFGSHGLFHEVPQDRISGMIAVNITALTELTRLFLPEMVERRRGRILNVASTAAFQPGPTMAVYCASKSYVLSFTAALSEELKSTGVSVTALCPGPTVTNFGKIAAIEGSAAFKPSLTMTPAAVAKIGYSALKQGKRVAVAGFNNRIGTLIAPLLPYSVLLPMVKKMMSTPSAPSAPSAH